MRLLRRRTRKEAKAKAAADALAAKQRDVEEFLARRKQERAERREQEAKEKAEQEAQELLEREAREKKAFAGGRFGKKGKKGKKGKGARVRRRRRGGPSSSSAASGGVGILGFRVRRGARRRCYGANGLGHLVPGGRDPRVAEVRGREVANSPTPRRRGAASAKEDF